MTKINNLDPASIKQIMMHLPAKNAIRFAIAHPRGIPRNALKNRNVKKHMKKNLQNTLTNIQSKIKTARDRMNKYKQQIKNTRQMKSIHRQIQNAKKPGGFIRRHKDGELARANMTPLEKTLLNLSKTKLYNVSTKSMSKTAKNEITRLNKLLMKRRNYILKTTRTAAPYARGVKAL